MSRTSSRVVDLAAVTKARVALTDAVRRWPRLTDSEQQKRLATHLQPGDSRTMPAKKISTETTQVAVRLAPDLLRRLDAAARKLSRPGLELTRADAIRIALETGLQSIEKESARG